MSKRLFGSSLLAASVALGFAWSAGCGGGSGSSSPAAPSPTPSGGTTGASTTIAIVGSSGPQSFNPDPASISNGATFAWKNSDGVTHHIVFDDGSMDSGNLAPGATSAVMTLRTNGARYHCTIHPSMVGAINTSTGTTPPCTGLYCDSDK